MNINQPSLNWNGSLTYNNNPNKIVLHNADASSCSVYDVHQWHLNNGWCGIGYHYFVKKDGSVWKGRPDGAQGSHCPGANMCSIGICFEGKYMEETMPSVQYNAGVELISYLFGKYGKLAIYGHKDIYNTDCPGTNFPLDNFKNLSSYSSSEWKTGWNKDAKGWWYCTDITNKYYYNTGWKEVGSDWYYFDPSGYAKQGQWVQNDKKEWYYLEDNCVMAKSEWKWIKSNCYCFDGNGKLYENCYTPDGYWVDEDGAWDSSVAKK